MRLQSAIFDMDGTLLDSMHIWKDLASDLVRSQGFEPEPGLGAKLKTMSLRQSTEYCKRVYGMTQSVEEMDALITAMVEDFYRNHVTAKPGVEKVLSLLKMQGVWMYVATATNRPLAETALSHAGLSDYFRGMVTCDEAHHGKDNPAVFERAMVRLQSNKRDTVVFEDSLQAILTAKAAGFRVAGVYDPSAEEEQDGIRAAADYYIRSFEDWFELVD
ncbi:MAG: HAD family phosphatase [Oscillibacter sp.]